MSRSSSAEELHSLFRGGSEISKISKGIALAIELLAAALAVAQIFGKINWPWLPLVVLIAAVLSAGLRSYSKNIRTFAQQCRRRSFRAFCLGNDLDPLIVSNASIDAPSFTKWVAKKLPARNLNEYYEPKSLPGERRLLELTAHSSFYTWRLLGAHAFLSTLWAILIFVVSFTTIYSLASGSADAHLNRAVLDALCSVALVQLCVRAIEASIEAYSSSSEARKIEEALMQKPQGLDLLEIVNSYEIERAGGFDAPTSLYRLMRNKLQNEWHQRRSAIL